MNAETQIDAEKTQSPPLPAPPGSETQYEKTPERCANCKHWEPDTAGCDGTKLDLPLIGYCPLFEKMTGRNHGNQCTAFEFPNSMFGTKSLA
jgi:hypothetical protein